MIFMLVYCNSKISTETELLRRIKTLEYSRNTDSTAWISLLGQTNNLHLQHEFVIAAGRVRSVNLLPTLKQIYTKTKDDSLRITCIFSIGQTGSREAEEFLLEQLNNSLPDFVQEHILDALSHCASNLSVDFLIRNFSKFSRFENYYITLSNCSRKQISAENILNFVSQHVVPSRLSVSKAYLLAQAKKQAHIPVLLNSLENNDPLIRKHLFRGLFNIISRSQTEFINQMQQDSISTDKILPALSFAIFDIQHWQTSFHAIQFYTLLRDTTLIGDLQKILTSDIISLHLAALKALARLKPEIATAYILGTLSSTPYTEYRGQLLNILTQLNADLAYPLIMNDLDKGDDFFKEKLLTALLKLNTAISFDLLKSFLSIESNKLANTAFNLLAEAGKITDKETMIMIRREALSSKYIALEYMKQKNIIPSKDLLIDNYCLFSTPSAGDLQLIILNIIKQDHIELLADELALLWEKACHFSVQQFLHDQFDYHSDVTVQLTSLSELPSYLQPDSLYLNSPTSPIIEIKTSRGNFSAVLHADVAPLTVSLMAGEVQVI